MCVRPGPKCGWLGGGARGWAAASRMSAAPPLCGPRHGAAATPGGGGGQEESQGKQKGCRKLDFSSSALPPQLPSSPAAACPPTHPFQPAS